MWRIAAAIAPISIMTVAHVAPIAPVASENGMVVAAQHLASRVGVEMPERGDNVVDAAVTVGYVLAVVYLAAGNLGGGGFMTIQLTDGRKTFLNFHEVAPKATAANMYLDRSGNVIKDVSIKGHLAVGVSGTTSDMEYAHEKCGITQRAASIAPAIMLADKGFVPDQGDVDMLYTSTKDSQEDAAPGVIFLNKRQPFQVDEKLVQHDLAKTLREISKHGADGLYKGWVGQAIVAPSKAGGSPITQDDLASHKTRELALVEYNYRGYHMVSTSSPSSGGVIICKMLNILEGYPLKDLGWHSTQVTHYQIEAMRHIYAGRNSCLDDPDFVKNPPDRLLSKNYAAKIRAVTDPKKVGVSKDVKPGVEPHEGSNTMHYLIADKYDNAVSVTYMPNDWSGTKVTVVKTGMILNDEMDDFMAKVGVPSLYGLVQGEADSIAPGKRSLSSMSPITVAKDGKPVIVVGMPSGSHIITAVMLTMTNAIDYGMNVQEVVDMPHLHQQWLPGVTNVEAYVLSEDTRKIPTSMGHNLGVPQPANHLAAIIIGALSLDGKPIGNNRFYGANDLRRNTGLAVGH